MNYISLVDYNKLFGTEYKREPSFSQLFGAFSLYTLTSLSLMIDRNIKVFDDEVFAFDKIDIENIKGIILPQYLTYKQLKYIPFLPGDHHCYTYKSINHLLDCLERYFDRKIDRKELLISVKQGWDIYESERLSITMAVKEQRKKIW